MTSFVHLEYSNQHPGVTRVESAIESAREIKRTFSSIHSLATLLLSAIAAAVMVVAYQVMNSMADGHLLVLWTAMWAVVFVALASLAGAARIMTVRIKTNLDGWSRNLAAKRADERLWAMAKTDARVMTDLQCAISRGDVQYDLRDEGLRFVPPTSAVVAKPEVVMSPIRSGVSLARAYQRCYI